MTQKQIINHIIVPGYGNSGEGHWQTLWQNRLNYCQRFSPTSWDQPNKDDWVGALERAVDKTDGPIVLIAHSLGCITVADWAASHTSDKILGALLVAIPDVQREDFPKQITGYENPSLAPLPFDTIAVLSSNDPYSALDRGRFFAKKFDARIKEIGPKGHINHESGLGEWHQGMDWLEELKTSRPSAVA
jgi:predicted alpha/beta hydrolase family esterase